MNVPMKAYSCASGGVMFVPEEIERKSEKTVRQTSNDNTGAKKNK